MKESLVLHHAIMVFFNMIDLDLELAVSEFLSLEGAMDTKANRCKLISVWNTIRKFGYHDGMSEKEFIDMSILIASKLAHEQYRKGQAVFNYIDEFFGLARHIQFNCHIDCFYDDSQIENFLSEAYKLISGL